MGNCEYCGKSAGWFHSYHEDCRRLDRERRIARQKEVDDAVAAMIKTARAAAESGEHNDKLEESLSAMACSSGLSEMSVKEAIVAGFEEAAEQFMAGGLFTEEEERLITAYVQSNKLTTNVLDQKGTWTRLGKMSVLRDLADGRVPERVNIQGDHPFVLNKTERIVWLFNDVRLLKQKVSRGERFWTLADEGTLAVTNENISFCGGQTTLRFPLHQIVTLIEHKDGFAIGKAGAQRISVFITGDAHFSTNLVRGLVEIVSPDPSARAPRNRPPEVKDATLLDENVWPVLPELPAYQEPISVQSDSGNGVYHLVLSTYTCSCPDWQQRRTGFAERDIRRVCKHISRILLRQALITDSVVRVLLTVGGCPPYNNMQKYRLNDDEIYFFRTDSSEWIDVVANARAGSQLERFGYSIHRDGWSYGRAPKNAIQVKRLLRRFSALSTGAGC